MPQITLRAAGPCIQCNALNVIYLKDAELVIVGTQQAHQAALKIAELLIREI